MSSITAQGITDRLQATLQPTQVSVQDESAAHAGHAGSNGSLSGTHFRVQIGLGNGSALSRVAKHRLVYDALHFEMANGVHALAIEFLD
jgi:BolA family transcriptional regulator, general stress-responsive regulator